MRPRNRLAKCLLALAGALAFLPVGGARAAYPDHIITVVVPFDVGGASDILARIVSSGISKVLGQTVLVENKGGAAGNIGMSYVTHSKPDGYTLLMSGPAPTQNPAMYRHMPYDPMKDMMGVAEDSEAYYVLAVNTHNVAATNMRDFITLLKERPGKYNASAGGLGTRLSSEFFRIHNGLTIEILPYNSSGNAGTALMAGETDFMIVDPSPLLAGISAGKIKVLAVSGPRRLASLPDVPTTAEAGFPGYEDFAYHGTWAPAGLPPEVAKVLNAAINQVTRQPDVIMAFNKLGWVPVQKSQKEFDDFYREEVAKWKDVVATAKIQPVD